MFLLVETLADSTADAADDSSDEEEGDGGDDDPDPEDGTAFSGETTEVDAQATNSGVNVRVLVTIGDNVKTSAVLDTDSSPPLLEETLHLLLSIVGSLVDIIIDIQEMSVG